MIAITNYKIVGMRIKERLQEITKHEIGSSVLLKDYSKNKKTVLYYDCSIEKYMKCTVTFFTLTHFTIDNIRQDKDANRCNENCRPIVMKLDNKCIIHGNQ